MPNQNFVSTLPDLSKSSRSFLMIALFSSLSFFQVHTIDQEESKAASQTFSAAIFKWQEKNKMNADFEKSPEFEPKTPTHVGPPLPNPSKVTVRPKSVGPPIPGRTDLSKEEGTKVGPPIPGICGSSQQS